MLHASATMHSRALAAIVSLFVHAPTPPGSVPHRSAIQKSGIGEFALQNHGSYARRHGYLHLTQANLSTVKARQYVAMIYPLAWAKLWLLMELFTDERFASVEFWAWLDADAFVVRHDWTLQSVFKRANGKPGCSVIVSWDIGYDDEARAWLSETERVAGSHNMKAARPFDKYRYIFNTGVMLLRNELNTIDLLTRAMDMAVRERFRSDWEQGAFTDLYLDHLHVRKVLCPVDRHLLQGMVKLPEDRELVDQARVWVAHVTDAKLDKSGVQALLSGTYHRRMKYSTPTGQKSRNSSFRDSSVSRGSAKRVPSELPWCIVESEDRPRADDRKGTSSYWQAAADRNERYARCHGYGFAYVEHTGGQHGKGCSHSVRGNLSPYWCKIPAVAHVLQHGINGRRCNRVVFLDSDVQIVNYSMSLDAYLEHGRSLGDEALIDDDWSLLFTSNAPHVNAGLCTGIFFARSKSDSCGILRNWWDANWPDKSRWSWEQGAMADGVHLYNRAYGARVRVLPTSHTWRAEDIPKLKAFTPPDRRDPLFYHRCSPTTGARSKDSGNCAPPTTAPDAAALHGYCSRDLSSARAEVALVKLPSAAMVFDEEKSLERCPAAIPRPGVTSASFMNARTCCNGSPLRPSLTHLDGTAVAPGLHRRPCWSSATVSANEEWTCWTPSAPRAPSQWRSAAISNILPSLQPPSPRTQHRIFDLVLINHEYDLAAIRAKEIGDCVDKIIFAQPTFNFATGEPVRSRPPFPARLLSMHPNVIFYPIEPTGLESSCMGRAKTAWCRESFARNALLQAFDELGGHDDDVIFISDADEIPRASAVDSLRIKILARQPVLHQLTSIHHFKYSLHCEERSAWQKGPVAIDAWRAREIGSNAVRLSKPPNCVASGYRSSCGKPHIAWHRVANASWHMSSLSGGIEGHIFKLRSNSETIVSNNLLDEEHVRWRMARCHDHLGRDKNQRRNSQSWYSITRWGTAQLPSYPDVPQVVDKLLKSGRFLHYLSNGTSLTAPRAADLAVLLNLPTNHQK